MAGGQVWIPVNASMRGFATTVAKEATKAAGAGGRELETGFRKGGEAAGQAAADGLAAQAKKVDAASRALSTARNAETQAASDAAVAEEKLNQLRASGNASTADLIKAETALETAKTKAADATARVEAREADLETVRGGGEATSRQLIRSEDQLAAARVKQTEAAGKERAAEAALEDAQRESAAAAERVEDATAALASARETYGDDSREAAAAEKELTRAQKDADKATMDVVKAQGQARKAATDLANAQDDARSKSMLLEGVQKDLEESHRNAAEAADMQGGKLDRFSMSAEEAEKASADLERAQKGLEIGIAAAGGAVVGAMGGLFAIGKDFHGMSREIAIGSGASGDALRDLEESAMSVAQTVPVSFEESANALAGLNTTTGETGPALEALTSQVLEASNLLGEDGVSNANSFGNALAQWEIDAATGADAMDGLFTVTQNYGIGLNEVTGHLNTYGSVLNNAGFEMEEAAVLFGSLDRAGLAVSRIMPGLNSAFRGWASENKDVQAELAKTVGLIESAETSQEALAIATDEFGAEGAQRLTTAIRNGSFALDDFDTALGNTEGAIADTAAENRTLEESFQLMKNEAMVALEPLATEMFDRLIPAVETAGEKFTDMIDWVQENEGLVKGLAVAVGGAAAGLVAARGAVIAFEAAMRIKNVALLISQKGWRGLNAAMKGNIFVLIATAVAGLVAGLVYFFTQTEKGQEIWATFTSALATGWDWVVEKLSAGWAWMKEHVFTPLSTFVSETVWPILQSVFGFIGEAWSALSSGIEWAYQNLIKPTFDFFVTAGKVLFAVLTTVVFTPLKLAWDVMSAGIAWAWENLIKPAWEMLQSAATFMWENVLQPVFGFIGDAWSALSDGIQWYYENVIQRAWDALGDALNWLYDNVVQPVLGWISDRWDDMANALEAGWRWIDDNVFTAMGNGLDTVKGWFETGVEAIRKIWDGLKGKLAEPINFVIDFVYNDGIKAVFDGVAEKIGLDARLPEIPKIKYADGGMMPGYTPGRDVHTFYSPTAGILELSGGEPVLRPEAGRVLGKGWVDNVNYVARTQGERGVERYLTRSHFADGGIFGGKRQALARGGFTNLAGALSPVQRSHAEFVSHFFPGIFNLTSATRNEPGSYHHTGQATDWQNPATYATQMPSAESKALAQAIHRVFPDTAELIHWPEDGWRNLLNGGPHNYGPGTNAQHANHVHWATNGVVQFDASKHLDDIGVGFSGGTASDPEASWGFWGKILDAVPSFDLDGFGEWAKAPGAALKTMGGWVKDWATRKLKEWADKFLNFLGIGGGGAEQWRPQAEEALRRHGYNPSDHIDAMLQQIDIESSGDPNAVNTWDSNAVAGHPSGGLLQVIAPTYQDVRRLYPSAFEGLPDDRFHPLTNLTAGVGAVKRDWGGPAGRWPTRGGYHAGGLAPAGEGWLHKTALEPEFVLSPDMTQAFIDWMRGTPHGESAAVVARELASAFAGEDWGWGELASYIGEDLAVATIDVVRAIGRAERGLHEWARATEDQDRMGTPDEWAMHFGAQAATALADEALGLFGLGGIVGQSLRPSLVNLINEAVPHANNALEPNRGLMGQAGLGDFYFGELHADVLQPAALLDDEGRRIGTQLDTADDEPEGADAPDVDTDDTDGPDGPEVATTAPAVATDAPDTTPATDAATGTGGARTVIKLEGGKVYAAEDLVAINDRLEDVEFEVDELQSARIADIVSGVQLVP